MLSSSIFIMLQLNHNIISNTSLNEHTQQNPFPNQGNLCYLQYNLNNKYYHL